jgi:uncharacterized OsmC-like protein
MYQASIVSAGDYRYHARTRDSRSKMGKDGNNTVDALLATLCACLGHYVGDFLHQETIQFTEYTVSANSELAEDRPRLADIHVTVEVKNAVLSEKAKAAMLEFIESQCLICGTLKANSKVLMSVA